MKALLFLLASTLALVRARTLMEEAPELFEHPKMRRTAGNIVDQEFLVLFHAHADVSKLIHQLVKSAAEVRQVYTVVPGAYISGVRASLLRKLQRSDLVLSIEPNEYAVLYQTLLSKQINPSASGYTIWGLDRTDEEISVLDNTYYYDADGTGTDIYVVDSGIRATHETFLTDTNDPTNTRVSCFWSAWGDDCDDWLGHGTHCAALAGGEVVGVAFKSSIHAVKVVSSDGSALISTIVAGLDYIKLNRNPSKPAVVSMSIGLNVPTTEVTALDIACDSLTNDGVTVVVAGGNSGADACLYSPAKSTAIAVGAINKYETRPSFSNYGACINIYAPGASGLASATNSSDNAYNKGAGTSFAAPHVAGAAALILQHSPCLGHFAVMDEIIARAAYVTIGGVGPNTPVLYTRPGATYPECVVLASNPSPSSNPSQSPSIRPSASPSALPSQKPSEKPSIAPSGEPSGEPSLTPTGQPSIMPSDSPTVTASESPSASPQPSNAPSESPSKLPSSTPSAEPSLTPSSVPSISAAPTTAPKVYSVTFTGTFVDEDGKEISGTFAGTFTGKFD